MTNNEKYSMLMESVVSKIARLDFYCHSDDGECTEYNDDGDFIRYDDLLEAFEAVRREYVALRQLADELK